MNEKDFSVKADQFTLLATYCRLAALYRIASDSAERTGKLADLAREMRLVAARIDPQYVEMIGHT